MKLRIKPTWFTKPGENHLVQIYSEEAMLDKDLLNYVLTGINCGDTCLVIATPLVLIKLQKALRLKGVDVAQALTSGQYVTVDAEEMLNNICEGQTPNTLLFQEQMKHMFSICDERGRPVRIFGEMVALLARDERLSAIAQLEHFWHDIMINHPCSLYCAYSYSVLARISNQHLLMDIEKWHDLVTFDVPIQPYALSAELAR